MKNLKKLIAVVLTFTLVFSAMAVGFAGTFSDVKDDASYAGAVARLSSLGLVSGMPNGTYNPDGAVTRAQMIAFVNAAKGLQDAAKVAAGPTKFSDVPANYWASGDINIANPDGYPDGTFKPDNTVTYPEALALLLRALGVTENLSWPYGVIAKAADIGLTDGVTLSANATINRGQMAILVNNALDLPLYKYDTNGNAYPTNDKLISKVGTSNDYLVVATNSVDSTVPAGYVDVQPATASGYGTYSFGSDKYINAGSVDFSKYLGEVVTVVADKSGKSLAVSPITTDTKTFTVATVPTVSGSTYSFSDISTSVGDIPVVIDGIKTTLSKVINNIDKGSNVTFINNDGKSGYDYAVVTDATGNATNEILVQKDVAASDKYIDNRIAVSDSNGNAYKVIGAVNKASDIKAGDVVYQISINGTTVLYVVRQTVTGTISQTSIASDGTTTVTINGKDYTLGTQIAGSTGIGVTAGSQGTAVLAKNNTIVQWTGTSTAATTNYAVVSATQSFNQWATQVQLALPDGTSKVYNIVYANFYPYNTSGSVYQVSTNDIVKYTVNSNGLIDTMSTISGNVASATYGTVDTTNNIIKFGIDPTGTNNTNIYYVSSSTVFFNASKDSNGKLVGLTPVKFADIANGSTHKLYASVKTGLNQISVVVFDDSSLTASTTKPLVYVTGVSTVYSSATTSFTRLSVLENGVAKTYDATGTLTGVTPKYVYQLTLDANGKVTTAGTALTPVNGTNGTTVTFDYANNGITPNGYAELPLDSNVVVIDSSTGTQVGLGSIASDTVVKLFTNTTTGKVVLIVK